MPGKYGLIIGNTEYTDAKLANLAAPSKDAEAFARLLRAPDLACFDDVGTLINQTSYDARRAIAQFFGNKRPDDLLLLYFSGHGIRDDQGRLFLATRDTDSSILDATAIPAEFVTHAMDNCRSKRQVLILDCCNSGAFAYGTKAAQGASMGTAGAFEGNGYGRVVLTATDATQFAYEGDRVIGQGIPNSLFTHFLIKGLEGGADTDGDGRISVDELYDYTSEQIHSLTANQKPEKFVYHQQERIILTTKVKPETIVPAPLDPELQAALESNANYVRKAAVEQLRGILGGVNRREALTAEQILKKIAASDDSLTIRGIAGQILNDFQSGRAERNTAEDRTDNRAEETPVTSRELVAEQLETRIKDGKAPSAIAPLRDVDTRQEPRLARIAATGVFRQKLWWAIGIVASLILIWTIGSLAISPNRGGRDTPVGLAPQVTPTEPAASMAEAATSPASVTPAPTAEHTSAAAEAATPLPTAVLFTEDFQDGFDPGWTGDSNAWIIVNGKAYPKAIYKGGALFAGDLEWTDYTVAVTTTSSTGTVTSYLAGIYVHYQDSGNFVMLMFNCDFPASRIEWIYKEGGQLISLAMHELNACVSDHYSLKIATSGSKYSALVDGEELSVELANVLPNGMVGLYSIENGGNAAAAFSNLVVSP